MSLSLLDIAENIFASGSKSDVDALIKVLQQYTAKSDPARAIRLDKAEISTKVIEKRANAQEVYLTSPQSVCPCCRR
jgi:hypothetical protein